MYCQELYLPAANDIEKLVIERIPSQQEDGFFRRYACHQLADDSTVVVSLIALEYKFSPYLGIERMDVLSNLCPILLNKSRRQTNQRLAKPIGRLYFIYLSWAKEF